MGLESTTTIAGLVPTNPLSGDTKGEGDDHIRLLKVVLQASFPGLAGALGRVVGKTASYGLVLNDNGSVIVFTAGASITLSTAVAASALGNGFSVVVLNLTGGSITFDPQGAETINAGLTTQEILPQHGYLLWTDSVQFFSMLVPTRPVPAALPGSLMASAALNPTGTGWLLCDGGVYARTTYPDLFQAIGGTHGAPDANTFQVPDLRGRTIFGVDPGLGLVDGNSAFAGHVLGFRGGSQYFQNHAHTGNTDGESTDHSHGVTDHYQDGTFGAPSLASQGQAGFFAGAMPHATNTEGRSVGHTHSFTTGAVGSGNYQNMPPAMMLHWIIKT